MLSLLITDYQIAAHKSVFEIVYRMNPINVVNLVPISNIGQVGTEVVT